MGMQIWKRTDTIWIYPQLVGDQQATGIDTIETYIPKRQNMFVQYIAMQPILDLCMEAERRSGFRIPRQRWEQVGTYLSGLREVSGEDGGGGRDKDIDGTNKGDKAQEVGETGHGGA